MPSSQGLPICGLRAICSWDFTENSSADIIGTLCSSIGPYCTALSVSSINLNSFAISSVTGIVISRAKAPGHSGRVRSIGTDQKLVFGSQGYKNQARSELKTNWISLSIPSSIASRVSAVELIREIRSIIFR